MLGLAASKSCLLTNAEIANQSSLCKALIMRSLVKTLIRVVRIDVVKKR